MASPFFSLPNAFGPISSSSSSPSHLASCKTIVIHPFHTYCQEPRSILCKNKCELPYAGPFVFLITFFQCLQLANVQIFVPIQSRRDFSYLYKYCTCTFIILMMLEDGDLVSVTPPSELCHVCLPVAKATWPLPLPNESLFGVTTYTYPYTEYSLNSAGSVQTYVMCKFSLFFVFVWISICIWGQRIKYRQYVNFSRPKYTNLWEEKVKNMI